MAASEFLDLYKQLEQVLKAKFDHEGIRYESPVVRFETSPEGREYREELTTIREIRNLLQHLPMVDGQFPVEPSPAITDSLRDIVEQASHPIKALEMAVRNEKIYKASMDSNLNKVMTVMANRGFSHIPVFQGQKMFGVLSQSSVFDCLIKNGPQFFTDQTKVSDLSDYLPCDNHPHEYFKFTSRDTPLYSVQEMFETTYQHSKRLVIVFITENGRPSERLLGLLSPWNVLRKKGK